MKGPWRVLSVQGSLHIFHFLWPAPNENDYWLYFCILCNKMGSRDSGETMVDPHWVWDPPWSFNGPWQGPTIHQTWPFIHWLYFCILCNKNGIKWLRGDQCWPPKGPGPALVPQWTLQGPYNTPNMVLYILAIFLHSMPQIWDHLTQGRQRLTPIGSRTRLGPSMDPAMALQYTKHGPQVYCKAIAGSIGGPRQVLDPMRVDICVPRVPWSLFCCIECKNIAKI